VRHCYATAGRDAKIDWKALSHRIGHSDVAFTMNQYVQTDLEADRQVANALAELINSCHPSGRDRCVKAREATACGLA
jgi:integrase